MTQEERTTQQFSPYWLVLGGIAGAVAGFRYWRQRRAQQTSPLIKSAARQVALVTGASSGIGRVFALKLAELGYDVILVARRRERLESLAAEITAAYGVEAAVVAADLSTEAGIQRVEQVLAATDTLALLVNNAGFGLNGPFAESAIDSHLQMVQVHVEAVVRLTRTALPALLARRRGAIINVSSLMAFYPMYGSTTYSATKCYLRAFTEALYQELQGTGVRAQVLCPGFVETELQDVAEIDRPALPQCFWMSPNTVVARSLRDLANDRAVSVPGLGYRGLAALSSFIPRPLLYAAGSLLGRSRERQLAAISCQPQAKE